MFRACTLVLAAAPLLWADAVRILPKFEAGQKFNVMIRKSRGGTVSGSTTMPVSVTVLEAGPNGSRLEWVPGETAFPESTHPLIAAASHAIRDLQFEIALDARGAYAGFPNERQIVPTLALVREQLLEQFLPLVSEAQRGQLRAYIHQAMSPAALASAAIRDAQLLFAINGVEIEPGKPLETEGEIRGPFGAGTVPGRTSLRVASVDPERREAVIAQRQDFDVEALPDVLIGLSAGPAPEGKGAPKLEMYDETEYVVDTVRNAVKSVRHARTTNAGAASRRTETTEIVLTYNP